MKTVIIIFAVVVLSILAGCGPTVVEKPPADEKPLADEADREFLTVDFQKDQPLRYRFVSTRDIATEWPSERKRRSGKAPKNVSKSYESMEMVVAYTPVEVDPYGLTTIRATCESVKIKRSVSKRRRDTKKDVVEGLVGKSFTFTVNAAGKIQDYSQLDNLVKEMGKKAFRPASKQGRIKNPDMIADFVVTQWFLWDSVSSLEKAAEGVKVGQAWKSKLSVPTPMPMRKARDVTYTLDEVRPTEEGRLAVIRSSYCLAESAPREWPIPYTGKFQFASPFGIYRFYKDLGLQGKGEELFNIDLGRVEKRTQNYDFRLEAFFPLPLGQNPKISIKQNLTMQLLDTDKRRQKTGK